MVPEWRKTDEILVWEKGSRAYVGAPCRSAAGAASLRTDTGSGAGCCIPGTCSGTDTCSATPAAI